MNAEIRFKDKRILEALEYIDEKYIDDVFDVLKEPDMTQNVQVKLSPFRHWKQYLALAACLILLAFATPIFGYVAEFIGSFAAGIGDHTSGITEDSDFGEETFNDIESTENEQTTEEVIPNFQYSDVKIITDNNTSINPISVSFGYSWYKDEKLVWTEEIASGWIYVMNIEWYKYENFPHLTLERWITSSLPENITVSNFKVYSTAWKKLEYSFDNDYELSNLPAGDYIIVGIEKEKIPYDKPHSVIGEYDYKSDESAIIFGLTVTDPTVTVNGLEYAKFTKEIEEIDYDTIIAVKNAWAEYVREKNYSDYYAAFIRSEHSEKVAHTLAQQAADAAAENAYQALFNSLFAINYGYLGRTENAVVIATYTMKEREPISMEIVHDLIIEICVYTDGSIISLEEAYKRKILSYDDRQKFMSRSLEYESYRFWYSTRNTEQTNQ